MRHLGKPSARSQALCGYTQNYFYSNMMLNLGDVNCPDCLAIVHSMHDTPPTTEESRYGQART